MEAIPVVVVIRGDTLRTPTVDDVLANAAAKKAFNTARVVVACNSQNRHQRILKDNAGEGCSVRAVVGL